MIIKKIKTIFIHIPKTAGDSIKSFFPNDDTTISKHATAKQLQNYLDKNTWNTYYKFTFVRNPFDQVVSFYNHLRKPLYEDKAKKLGLLHPYKACKAAINNNFNTFVKIVYKNEQYQQEENRNHPWTIKHFQPQIKWLLDNDGNLVPDFVGHYETLQKDFNSLCKKLNIKQRKLPIINASKRKSNYKNYYNQESIKIISEFFKTDLETFNYQY